MDSRKLARSIGVSLILICLVLSGSTFSLPGALVHAQTTDGRLVVTVRDDSGASIAGAAIVVVNSETKQQYDATTTDTGTVTLAQVPVGTYTVTVTATGFATKITENVKVDVGQSFSLAVDLNVGGIGDSVTVLAGESLVQSTNAELTTTVNQQQIQDLPLDGRDPLQLIQLQAGVSIENGRGGVTINGQRTSTATVTQDGITIQDYALRGNALTFSPNRTTVSQVSEFSVTTQNGGADSTGSSAIRLITPSGGNDFHGEVFEYHRNDAFGANDFFNNATDNPREQLIRNQYGFSLSGPVMIPKFFNGRDKLFFFGTYEGFRERAADSFTTAVLSQPARDGLFTYRRRDNGQLNTINVLDVAGVSRDPIATMLLGLVPLPNGNFGGDLVTTAGYTFNKSRPRDRDQFAGRLDYIINERNRIEAIYQFTDEKGGRSDIDGSYTILPVVSDPSTTHFAVTAWTWNVTDALTNELRVGVNNQTVAFTNDQENILPYFVIFPQITDPQVAFDPQARRTITSSLIDNASYLWNDHLFRFGTRIDRIRLRSKTSFNVIPRISLGVIAQTPAEFRLAANDFPGGLADTTDLTRANALVAALGGLIANGTREFNVPSQDQLEFQPIPPVRNHEINQYALYVSDQWRIHPKVTLNLGIRWDYTTPLRERDDLGLLPVTPGTAGLTDPNGTLDFIKGYYNNPDRNNFGPNIGVAWDVFGDGKTTVRGGFSMAFVNDETVRSSQILTDTNPGLGTLLDTGNAFGGQLGTDVGSFIGQFLSPPSVELPLTYSTYTSTNPSSFIASISPDLKTPHYKQWNFSIEREVGWDTAVAVRYVGNKGYDLLSSINQNPLDTVNNGFAAEVARAQNNGFLAQARNGVFDPRYNPDIRGSVPLPLFASLPSGGFITNPVVSPFIARGEAYGLAALYVQNGLAGDFPFAPNPNVFFAILLDNKFTSDYHGLQTEVRRRFSQGLTFQANYSFSKVLGFSNGLDQNRQDFPAEANNLNQDRRRLLYDQTHSFKMNAIYELPIGDGKWLDPENSIVEGFAGGWRVTSILNWYTGAPISILSNRRTVTNFGELVHTTLTADQIHDLLGVYERNGVLYYIDPSVIGPNGAAASPDGQAPFDGQVFFNPGSGEHGSLGPSQFNGPSVFNWDASVIKEVKLTERVNLELRGEMFNVLNHPIFFITSQNINSTTFGRIGAQLNAPRVVQLAAKITF